MIDILIHLFVKDKMYKDTSTTPARLVMVALAHGLSLFSAVASSINVSGGHVNPAVTFGALLGGRISLIRAVYYWVAQLLGAIVACLLLLVTAGMVVHINISCTYIIIFFWLSDE